MCRIKMLGIASAAATVLAVGPAAALAANVIVRVEGKTRMLLAPTSVRIASGWITKHQVATGKCPAASANGALDAATHGRWDGTWRPNRDKYAITSILGETYGVRSHSYWGIWINNKYATAGACQTHVHAGEQILFAVERPNIEDPLALIAPTSATRGQTVTGKVVYYNRNGRAKPLAGALVSVNGHSGTTGSQGTVPLTPDHAGTYTLVATDPGYIRAPPVTLHVA